MQYSTIILQHFLMTSNNKHRVQNLLSPLARSVLKANYGTKEQVLRP